MSATYADVRLAEVHRNPGQPRKRFDPDRLAELAASIRETGVLQPITLRPRRGGGYVIVAGERRWRASQMAGLTEIPAVIQDSMSDGQAYVASVAENLARADMTIMEESEAYATLIREHGLTTGDIAKSLGRTQVHIEWRLGLLSLTDDLRALVDDGSIRPNLAWHIARLSPENQALAARRYLRGEFSGEHEAANFAQALAMSEQQGSFFEMAEPETPAARERRQRARRETADRLTRAVATTALLLEIADMDPKAMADALGDDVATHLAALETLAAAASKARRTARRAKGYAEARTYAIAPAALPEPVV